MTKGGEEKAEQRYPKMPALTGVVKGSLPQDMVVFNTLPPEALARANNATNATTAVAVCSLLFSVHNCVPCHT